MLKKRWFITAVALFCGIILGTMGVVLVENPTRPTALLTLMQGKGNNAQVVNAAEDQTSNGTSGNNGIEGDDSLGPAGSTHSSDGTDSSVSGAGKDDAKTAQIKETIISDYKQDIGTLFDAWKSKDMTAFRATLEKAYTGDLLEKHIQKASPFFEQGTGINVSYINFDQVEVESLSAETATLKADYHYMSSDYDLVTQKEKGEPHEQTVHVRVDLIKIDSHWMITGETSLS